MIINIKGVSFKKDNNYILKNINWNVQQGEHWAIIGLNGSGKTSLLKLINGYNFPSEGEMTVLGKKFGSYDFREVRKSIGWVSSSLQEALYVNETVEDIVISGKFASIGLYEKPDDKDIKQANDILEKFNSLNLKDRIYYTLSQGEKQKVILARALMATPKLLILDEPCTGLDIFARETFLNLVEQIGNAIDPPTLIYVSHHIEEILPIFRHTLLLKNGEVHSSGTNEDVLTKSNLVNFFERQIEFILMNERIQIR